MMGPLQIAAAGAFLGVAVFSARADSLPYVVSAVLGCDDRLQLDVTFDEPMNPENALDPFNYIVFQTASSGAPRLLGDNVTQISDNGSSFRVTLEHGAFVPDAQSVLRVLEYVTDMAGNAVWPEITRVTPCPKPVLKITRVNPESFQMSWTTNAAGFRLEFTTTLSATDWQPVTDNIVVAGDQFTVRLEANTEQRWYRLRKP